MVFHLSKSKRLYNLRHPAFIKNHLSLRVHLCTISPLMWRILIKYKYNYKVSEPNQGFLESVKSFSLTLKSVNYFEIR